MNDINNLGELEFLDIKKLSFKRTEGSFVSLNVMNGEFYPRVDLYRIFPLSKPYEYISVRDREEKEIGIIRSLDELDRETADIIASELERRYFSPEIKQIVSLKDEYGYVYMDIRTTSGEKQITVPAGSSNFVKLKDNRIIVIDTDGNRFDIRNYMKLDTKSIRLLETVI